MIFVKQWLGMRLKGKFIAYHTIIAQYIFRSQYVFLQEITNEMNDYFCVYQHNNYDNNLSLSVSPLTKPSNNLIHPIHIVI